MCICMNQVFIQYKQFWRVEMPFFSEIEEALIPTCVDRCFCLIQGGGCLESALPSQPVVATEIPTHGFNILWASCVVHMEGQTLAI